MDDIENYEDPQSILVNNALEGKWEKVVAVCDRFPNLCTVRMFSGGNTALHLAVSERQESVVRQLVGVIASRFKADHWNRAEDERILETRNEEGNTALHLAASIGNVAMCKWICDGRPRLLGAFNEERESPLFLAARHGMIDAFTFLQTIIGSQPHAHYLLPHRHRNLKGETILHCAISGEHWKLAFLIFQQYPDLHFSRNEDGEIPLHLLANNPGAFRSGTYLSLFEKLIYHCVHVEPLPPSPAYHNKDEKTTAGKEESEVVGSTSTIPSNYDACLTFFSLLNAAIRRVMGTRICKEESELVRPSSIPPNYDACSTFFSLLTATIWRMIGRNYIEKIKKKKEANIFSVKIMHRLLQELKRYEWQDLTKRLPESHEARSLRDRTWGLLVRLGEESLRTDQITLAGEDGVYGDPIIVQGRTAKPMIVPGINGKILYDEICSKYMHANQNGEMVRVVQTPTFVAAKGTQISDGMALRIEGNVLRPISITRDGEKNPIILQIYPIARARAASSSTPDQEKNPLIVIGRAAQDLNRSMLEGDWLRRRKLPTPLLPAAKNGITEMVEKILDMYPIAIHDLDVENKNALLLAVENRQPHVYQLLLKRYGRKSGDALVRAVASDGCGALHLAARLSLNRPSFILGSLLEMQQEVLWYEYVKASMPRDFLTRRNNMNETANEIFMKDHKELMEKGKQWVKETATACSVVGTFIATMAYTASTTAPGGDKKEGDSGNPSSTHEQQAAVNMFAITSFITLSFSITSVVMFLATFISRNHVRDFARDLPVKLFLGLTCLFISILSMLVTSCAGPFFLPKNQVRISGLATFAITCLPAAYFVVAQLPLYVELIWVTFRAVPRRWVEEAWW